MAAKVKWTVDVVELTNKVAGSSPQRLQSYLQTMASTEAKREFGRKLIDAIEERMDRGIDKEGKQWKRLSKAYADSLQGKIYGKQAGGVSNLKMTGEMRASFTVERVSGRTIQLGFSSQEQNDKAHGHINGGGGLPVRDFLGLPESEMKSLLLDTISEFEVLNFDFDFQDTATVELDGSIDQPSGNAFFDEEF